MEVKYEYYGQGNSREDTTVPGNSMEAKDEYHGHGMEVKYEYYGQGNSREDTTVPGNSMEAKGEYHGQGMEVKHVDGRGGH